MEFDCYPHYFFNDFDTEEDFYKSTAPSEDIWKKFELLPTPPMSPTRTLSSHLSPGDTLSWLTKVLGQDEECEGHFIPDTEELFGNLSSIIIQDCMWSSFSASKQLEKVNAARLSSSSSSSSSSSAVQQPGASPPLPPLPPLSLPPQLSVRPSKAQCVSLGVTSSPQTECVDPAAVLTFPPTNSCRKPPAASSGSESRSDSSDDDEEEIDVVTVESKKKQVRLVNSRKPITITVRADPCPKRFHMSVHRQQHNYAARSPDSSPEPEEEEDEDEDDECKPQEPQRKRSCTAASQRRSPSTSPSASPSETPQTSDAEDSDRRRNHNFLERKRRNDLRSRFLALRDQIPGLDAAKAPKVAILTQATEYVVQLHTREKQLIQERKRVKSKQQRLLNRLAELKRS